jgi:hypothetical protein
MKRCVLFLLFLFCIQSFYGQARDSISIEEATRIILFLASDSLKGRANETKELQQAAYFIEEEFRKDSLSYFPGFHSYLQPYSLHELTENQKQKDSNGHFISPKILFNVIGVLPGNKLPNEAIIFSAHYDHIGVTHSGRDTIFNGANDDASGTTALLMIAHYYAQKKDNARTLIFCAFSGEELGLIGSNVFVNTIDLKNVIAGINIEMIGNTNAALKNSFYITGERLSNLNRIVRKNLKGTGYRVVSEPDEKKNLFRRSDNYSFAQLGIPAHTFMCSDDNELCYHKVCDEVKRIDIPNMVNVIRAILLGTRSLVDGKDKPGKLIRN